MTASAAPSLRIVHVGVASTIQDDGRQGWSHLGVPTAGPVDRRAHDEVNRLVGNMPRQNNQNSEGCQSDFRLTNAAPHT